MVIGLVGGILTCVLLAYETIVTISIYSLVPLQQHLFLIEDITINQRVTYIGIPVVVIVGT